MSTNIQETIDRLRELGQKASPAPWSYLILPVDTRTGAQDSFLVDGAGCWFATNAEDAFTRNDFDFMLEARNAIPELIAEIERLTAENEKLKETWEDGYKFAAYAYYEGPSEPDDFAHEARTHSPYREDEK